MVANGFSKNRAASGDRSHTSSDNSSSGDLPKVRNPLTKSPKCSIDSTGDPRSQLYESTNGIGLKDELEEEDE